LTYSPAQRTAELPVSLSLSGPRKLRQIREVFSRAGYTEPRILKLLDIDELPTPKQQSQVRALYLWRTRGGSRLETLVHLFLLRQAVNVEDVYRVIGPTQLEHWADVGLMGINGYEVVGLVELRPYGSLIVAADWPDEAQPNLHQVMGIAASSRTLAQATIRRHSRATLDLGTGAGILALLAAAHTEHVVAVDSNPRALATAQLNARLNGLAKIEFLEGDLFEPVRGRQFDLIVCNPPFVVAPQQIYLHSHNTMPLDRFCETVVRTAPAFMDEGGHCQLVCNWVQMAGEDWRDRLASWFAETGCDAWILHSHSEDVADYAFNRISNLAPSVEQLGKQLKTWMDYYERERIEAIGFGLINMRRSSKSSHWFRCDSWPEMIGPCGEAIEQGFACRDFLEINAHDRRLLEACLRHAPKLRWRQDHDISAADSMVHSSLQLTSGLAYTINVDPDVADFVSRCTGERRLIDHVSEIAVVSGQDLNRLVPRFLKVVRRLIELGFLLPACKN
jgi:SAM-dependent methyltransferase